MSFDEILASLGETGELGESPRQRLITDRAKKGEFAPAHEAKANNSPRFAPDSPSPKPAPIQEIRPIRPIRPGEVDEAIRLVKQCGRFYGFSESEFSEAIAAAIADLDAALACFRAVATEIKQENRE